MSTKQVKTPTAPAVSAVLRKAGFTKSVSYPSRIKGWKNHSSGYVVRKGMKDGTVEVYHETGAFRPSDGDRKRQAERQADYANALSDAGYAVAEDASWRHALIVTAKEGGQ